MPQVNNPLQQLLDFYTYCKQTDPSLVWPRRRNSGRHSVALSKHIHQGSITSHSIGGKCITVDQYNKDEEENNDNKTTREQWRAAYQVVRDAWSSRIWGPRLKEFLWQWWKDFEAYNVLWFNDKQHTCINSNSTKEGDFNSTAYHSPIDLSFMVNFNVRFNLPTHWSKPTIFWESMYNIIIMSKPKSNIKMFLDAYLLFRCHSDWRLLEHHHWEVWRWQSLNDSVHLSSCGREN